MYMFLFPLSLFLSASLLFVIQPMVAKVLLPLYGGTPALWTVCMLFFQALLLIGYSYAWVLSRIDGKYSWRIIHLAVCLLSICTLPLVLLPKVQLGIPEFDIFSSLLFQLGLPLLVVASSAPLLQYAYSKTASERADDPYFLYVASNIGSLLALLSYPWLVERFFGINQQFQWWNIIYLVYLILLAYILLTVHYKPKVDTLAKDKAISWKSKANWIFLSFIPCSLMLGVTFYISTDVAATPLFWVLPLALYLLSFVITFAKKPIISHEWIGRNALIFMVFPILGFIIGINTIKVMEVVTFNLLAFFTMALLSHGKLNNLRPKSSQLTTFYFCLSFGGVLAGIFNGFIAPRIFSHAYEYPLVLLLSLLIIPISKSSRFSWPFMQKLMGLPFIIFILLVINYYIPDNGFTRTLDSLHVIEILALLLIVVLSNSTKILFLSMTILFFYIFSPLFNKTEVLSQQRNFYGVKQVFKYKGAHVLMSQSTLHGFQVALENNPVDGARAYYGAVLPVVEELQNLYQPLHATILGLGTGIMACQFHEQDKLTIVEIDEQVIDIAKNNDLFTYLRDCPPQPTIIKDDGLIAAKRVAESSQEIIVMDAFNSDAIPVHLLTLEAFAVYKQKINANGVILVNMTNRHLNILPVITGAGRALDLIVLHKAQSANNSLGQFPAEWALLTSNERLAGKLISSLGWQFVASNNTQLWTNDYSNLIPLLKL